MSDEVGQVLLFNIWSAHLKKNNLALMGRWVLLSYVPDVCLILKLAL